MTVYVVDRNGNPCPNVNQLVRFNVKGAGTYRAAANGDATCSTCSTYHRAPLQRQVGGRSGVLTDARYHAPGGYGRGLRKGSVTIQTKLPLEEQLATGN